MIGLDVEPSMPKVSNPFEGWNAWSAHHYMAQPNSESDLRTRLYWLMGLRVLFVTLLLGFSIAFHLTKGHEVQTFYILIASTYILTLFYGAIIRTIDQASSLIRFAHVQIGVDLILESLLVAVTGGIESPFVVLFMVSVSLASLIPGRRIGLAAASSAVLLFGFVINIQMSEVLSLREWIVPSRLSFAETLHTFGIHGAAFLVVGFLSGALSDQLRRADQTLLEKERGFSSLQAFHENIVQSISSGVFTTNEAGQLTSFNPAAQEATGYSLNEVKGKSWREIFNWRETTKMDVETGTSPVAQRFEVEGVRADESRMVLGMTLSPLIEGGVQRGLVGVFKDLTQIRDMEEEMRRREWLATLGEMSAGMAHEIRNPLGALAGAMQMLRKDLALEDNNRHLMDIAVREANRLDAIIKEFLQYARPPALNLEECDINSVLQETLALIEHEAKTKAGLSMNSTFGEGTLTVQADSDQLKQVFWNLARNAFQAMPEGGRLDIRTSLRRVGSKIQGGEIVEVTFQDTGLGIKKELFDKIFLPFFTTKKEGSGLGLAAIDRIVDLHGGWIRVESEEGKGAMFAVCLPRNAESGPRLWHEGRGPWKKS